MIAVSQRGPVAILTISHGKANALDIELCNELTRQFEVLKASPAQAVVLTAEGNIFSAGVDLIRLLEGTPAYIRDFMPALSTAFASVFFHPKPVVSAINGHAIAGGCVLACCADRKLMARGQGRIGVPELLVGVPFPPTPLEILRFATSPKVFQEIIFGGATYTSDLALARGLVDDVVESDQLLDRAIAAAEAMAAISPAAFALTKRQMHQSVFDRLRQDSNGFDASVNEVWFAPETAERIREYVARTFKKA